MTNVELARRVGISAPPCLRRVRALERGGFITGYHADIEPKAMGFNVTVFAQVGLASQAEHDLQAFEERVGQWPEVRECYMLAGETDFILKVIAEDWDAYETFLTSKLTPAPNVTHVKSALSIRRAKYQPGVPIVIDESSHDGGGGENGDNGMGDDDDPAIGGRRLAMADGFSD